MKRLQFNAQGKLVGVDGNFQSGPSGEQGTFDEFSEESEIGELRRSDSLTFLQQQHTVEPIRDESGWSLWSEGKKLEPLCFSNGKTQEDVVDEVVALVKKGKKVIFIHGVCGTGKSAIALNIARRLGRTSLVVPVKGLQRQYEEDYAMRKYLVKPDGKRLSIAMITGRENHDSIIKPGASCADPFLPDTIKIAEKNFQMLREYYFENPFIRSKMEPTAKALRRISIAPANPYWSPIISADYELPLRDARKKDYEGLCGKKFTFYHRKEGCSYYDQYQAYIDADVLIFNSAKYLVEIALDRKPDTAVDIIDEADEFLDSFSAQEALNLNRLSNALQQIQPESIDVRETIGSILTLIKLEEQRVRAVGVNEQLITPIAETNLGKIVSLLLKSPEFEAEIELDELNYCNTALDIAKTFHDFLADTYVTYRRKEADLVVDLVTTNLSQKFAELLQKINCLILMSGTLHSPQVLRDVYGMEDFQIVEAESQLQGTIDIHRTGKELNCSYASLNGGDDTRVAYLRALETSLAKAKRPTLVHVHAFRDLPSEQEIRDYGLQDVMSREVLLAQQLADKTGKEIVAFKEKKKDILYSTRCARGVDFPGELCNSVVFTKYPNPNVSGVFWKVLQKTHAKYYWEFYRDKAQRDFLQRLYRALRSKHDHVFILSPDIRVLDAVRKVQEQGK